MTYRYVVIKSNETGDKGGRSIAEQESSPALLLHIIFAGGMEVL